MSTAGPGEHAGPRDPWRGPRRLGGSAVAVGVAAVDLWLFFFALDGIAGDLDARWSDHPYLLAAAGWLPAGGFLAAGGAVALRLEHVRRQGRRFGRVEENVYGWGLVAWFGFASLMVGKQGRAEPYRPEEVVDRVAHISASVSAGVSGGAVAVLLALPLIVLGYGLGRLLPIPRPGWPFTRTVASWLWGASAIGLGLALLSVPPR